MSAAVLREVRLYGPLRARFGRSHWLAVDSPAEAVRALCVLFAGFREALLGHKGPGYHVMVGEGDRTHVRDVDTLTLSAGSALVIRICPVLHGRKKGWGKIIGGLVIAVIGVFTSTYDGGFTLQAGISLMLGGAIQLLSPQRQGNGSDAKNETSYTFNGPVNVVAPGGPVPLLIGRVITGSVVASAGISTDETPPPVVAVPDDPELPTDQPVDPSNVGGP